MILLFFYGNNKYILSLKNIEWLNSLNIIPIKNEGMLFSVEPKSAFTHNALAKI